MKTFPPLAAALTASLVRSSLGNFSTLSMHDVESSAMWSTLIPGPKITVHMLYEYGKVCTYFR